MPTIFDTAAGAIGNANTALQTTVAPGAIGNTMNGYLNQHLEQVLNNALSRNRHEMNTTLNNVKAGASQSGAYGGSRQAVLEGETIGQYGRNADDLTASLLSQGYDSSAALALSELGLMQSGAGQLGALGSTAFGMGQQANAGQLAAGNQQQEMLQALISGANNQYSGYMGQPTNTLTTMLAALSGNPLAANSSTTTAYRPGLYNYLGMGAGLWGAGK